MIHKLFTGVQRGVYRTSPNLGAVTLAKSDERVTVLWTKTPRPATVALAAVAPGAIVYARDGSSQTVAAVGGKYQLDLHGATHNTVEGHPNVYQIGGAPLIVVEKGPAAEAQVDVLALGDPPAPVDAIGLLSRVFGLIHESGSAFAPNGR
jgi:hypothetical protein